MADFTESLNFTQIQPGVDLAMYVEGPVEVQVVRLKAGTQVGMHTHTNSVVHLVISGRIRIGETEYGPFGDYRCGGFEYGPWAIEDTVMLIIQPLGTEFEFTEPK